MLEFVGPNLVPCQNYGNALIFNCCQSWVFLELCVEWNHLELIVEIVIYWKELENKQEMKHSRFMRWNNCIN
jgi:hypothetical protein